MKSHGMYMKYKLLLIALGLSFVGNMAVAANIVCPESIVETPNVSTEVKGWNSVAPTGKRWLENVGIYFGSISDLGALVPDSEATDKGKETATWEIRRPSKDAKHTDAYWIGCSYEDTNTMLFQKVDAEATMCVASYELLLLGKGLKFKTMNCR